MHAMRHAVEQSVASNFWAQARLILPDVYKLTSVFDAEEIALIFRAAKVTENHDDDGGHHIGKEKPTRLPWVAEKIWPHVAGLRNGSCCVDPMMKLYRLRAGAGEVARHVDKDFSSPDGMQARDSILIYLTDNYTGGETIFNGTQLAPHGVAGSGLFFGHDVPHEARKVETGTKFVLKTDLFVIPC